MVGRGEVSVGLCNLLELTSLKAMIDVFRSISTDSLFWKLRGRHERSPGNLHSFGGRGRVAKVTVDVGRFVSTASCSIAKSHII